jgi:hypothetical protein
MAFTSVQISSVKLENLIRGGDKSVAMVAQELGVSLGTVWRWLKGPTAGVDPRRFHKLLALFEIDADDLKAGGDAGVPIVLPPELHTNLKHLAGKRTIVEYLAEHVRRHGISQRNVNPHPAGRQSGRAIRESHADDKH